MQQVVTLVSVETKTGTSARGPWTRFLFGDGGGTKYQTFDLSLGQRAQALLNQPVTITWDDEQRDQYINHILKSIEASQGQPPQQQPGNQYEAPQPQQAPQPVVDVKQSLINRSAALARAIETVQAGIVTGVNDPHQLLPLADIYVRYIEGGSAAFQTSQAQY